MSDINQRAMYARWRELMMQPKAGTIVDRAHVMDVHPERVDHAVHDGEE